MHCAQFYKIFSQLFYENAFMTCCCGTLDQYYQCIYLFSYHRTQQESDLRENHPLFDTPLFMVGRESRFREICKTVVNARYASNTSEKVKYKKLA